MPIAQSDETGTEQVVKFHAGAVERWNLAASAVFVVILALGGAIWLVLRATASP